MWVELSVALYVSCLLLLMNNKVKEHFCQQSGAEGQRWIRLQSPR